MNKKGFLTGLIIVLSAACKVAAAQDLTDFMMKDGWRWSGIEKGINGSESSYDYWLDGDTVIGGKSAMKVFRLHTRSEQQPRYAGAVMQEGKSVFFCHAASQEWHLLYKFDVEVGDVLYVRYLGDYMVCRNDGQAPTDEQEYAYLRADSIDHVLVEGTPLRRIAFSMWFNEQTAEEDPFAHVNWVEGIGSSTGLLDVCPNLWPSSYGHWMTAITDSNGKTLFTKEDFWSTIVGIAQKSLVMSNRHASELYDLQGRSVQSGSMSAGNADLTGLPRGIYVVKSGGKARKVAVK